MSGWSATATLPSRKTGVSWRATDTVTPRAFGPGWYTPVREERVANLQATGSLTATIQIKYPSQGNAFGGSGTLSVTIKQRHALAAAFSGLGSSFISAGPVQYIAAAFGATGDYALAVNDGLWAVVSGGAPFFDGLSATVERLTALGVSVPLTATGSLTATVAPKLSTAAGLAGAGALTAGVTPRYAVSAGLAGAGSLTAGIVPRYNVSATFSATGDLTATATKLGGIPFALSATGSLTATSTQKYAVVPALAANGALTSTVVPKLAVALSLTASGSLTAGVVKRSPVSAPLSGSGTLSATVKPQFPVTAVFGARDLVLDPTFENTTIAREAASWPYSDGSVVYSTEQAHSGTRSLKLTNCTSNPTEGSDVWCFTMPHALSTSNGGDLATGIKVQPGQRFHMEGWFYPKVTNDISSFGSALLAAQVSDTNGINATTWLVFEWVGDPPLGQWSKLSGYITIPDGYDTIFPYVENWTDTGAPNIFYWDDVTVQEDSSVLTATMTQRYAISAGFGD